MKDDKQDHRRFDGSHLDVLEAVIDLIPGLADVALAAITLRRKGSKYPIENVAELYSRGAEGDTVKLGDRAITRDQVSRFFPPEFFPIASEQELITRLFLAFQRGRIYHEREDAQRLLTRAAVTDEPATHLPAPVPML